MRKRTIADFYAHCDWTYCNSPFVAIFFKRNFFKITKWLCFEK